MKYFLYLAIAALLTISANERPGYNWDVLTYVASAKSLDNLSPDQIHAYIYDYVKNEASDEVAEKLLNPAVEYRVAMQADSGLFAQQLPFYKPRVLYIYGINGLQKLGVNPFRASHLISVMAVFTALLIFAALLFGELKIGISGVLFPLLLLPLGLYMVAIHSTPDGLVLLFFAAVALMYCASRTGWLLLLLPVGILIRTDLILLVACMTAVAVFGDRLNAKGYLLSAATAVAAYLLLNTYFNSYGWSATFYVSFVERVFNPAEAPMDVTLAMYLKVLARSSFVALKTASFMAYVVSCGLILHYQLRDVFLVENIAAQRLLVLHHTCAVYVIVHFLLFPAVWERFFIGPYGITVALGIYLVTRLPEDRKAIAAAGSP